MDWLPQFIVLGEVVLAMALGGLIGLEREIAQKPAGFRTHMLVAGVAAILVGVAELLLHRYQAMATPDLHVGSDPIRVVQAIVTGVSFLGAGTIFRQSDGRHVEGLTTAATILMAMTIGIAVGSGQFVLAIGATLLTLVTLRGVGLIERKAMRRQAED